MLKKQVKKLPDAEGYSSFKDSYLLSLSPAQEKENIFLTINSLNAESWRWLCAWG